MHVHYFSMYIESIRLSLPFFSSLGEHLPLHSDGVLLHPDTMRECNVVIAGPVVVRTFFADTSKSTKQVVCKAWPLTHLPLDGT